MKFALGINLLLFLMKSKGTGVARKTTSPATALPGPTWGKTYTRSLLFEHLQFHARSSFSSVKSDEIHDMNGRVDSFLNHLRLLTPDFTKHFPYSCGQSV